MGGLLGLVVLVLDIIAIVDCVKSSFDTGKKILWIVLILILFGWCSEILQIRLPMMRCFAVSRSRQISITQFKIKSS